MPRLTLLRALAAACLLGILIPASARAQVAQQQIHINGVATTPESVPSVVGFPGLSLDLMFTVLNENSEPAVDAEVEKVTLTLGTDVYAPVVQKVETPWSIVILMDGSTTVANYRATSAYRTARTAAMDSIEQAPDGSSFAVLQFSNTAPTILDFTMDTEKVKTVLKGLQPNAGTNSCLYNGLAEAINHLVGTSGQRVVILFTASADNCAQRQPAEIANYAQQNNVQIYAVGLRGYSITEADLSGVVDPTGGLATLREESDLVFGFNNIMALLSNHWQAKMTIYPAQGDSTALLTVSLKDGTTLSSPSFAISSEQAYRRPPEIHLKGEVQPTRTGVTFNLDIVNPDLISQLSISVISKKTGDPVYSETLERAQETNRLPIPGMAKGDDYQLVVKALDDQGRSLSGITVDFQYEPPETDIKINSIEVPTADRSTFVITIANAGLEGAASYKLWLTEGENNTPVDGTATTVLQGEPLEIPSKGVSSGQYQVVIQALDSDGATLAQVTSDKIKYKRPNPLDTLAAWGKDNPLVIGGVALVCGVSTLGLVGVVFLILPKRRHKLAAVELAMPERMRRAAPAAEPSIRQPAAPRPVSEPPRARPAAPAAPAQPVSEPPRARPAAPAAAQPISEPPRARPAAPAPAQPISEPPRPRPVTPAAVGPSEPPVPKARLAITDPVTLRQTVDVTTLPFAIGRRAGNNWVLNIDNKWGVSGKHATITYKDGQYYIEDNESTFGTLVNGEKIPPRVPIALNDKVEIGLGPMVKILFQIGDAPLRSSERTAE
jgi:hypothetical protein